MTRSSRAAIVSAVFLWPLVLPEIVVLAGSVALPFTETFNTATVDAVATYPMFTAQVPAGEEDPLWYVNAAGQLRSAGASPVPLQQPSFSVKPATMPTGEIVIKVDLGWNNQGLGNGEGGCGLRLGQFEDTLENENSLVFHPGYPGGALRVEGDGGFGNSDMGWSPAPGVMHHLEIHSFPNGLFNLKLTDGQDATKVYNTSFTNTFAYGGDVGLLAHGPGGAMYDNLSISLPGQTLAADLDSDGDVDGADFLLIQRNFGSTINASTYAAWKSTFGTHLATTTLAAVPEPTVPVLSFAAALGLGALRKRGETIC
jgi:hypothetical protein